MSFHRALSGKMDITSDASLSLSFFACLVLLSAFSVFLPSKVKWSTMRLSTLVLGLAGLCFSVAQELHIGLSSLFPCLDTFNAHSLLLSM